MTDERHDFSRVDSYLQSRRRVAFLHAVWRPMLAGGAGAAIIIAAVAIAQPRFTTREVIVDHVVQKDVSVDRVIPHDVTINNLIPHDIPIEIPASSSRRRWQGRRRNGNSSTPKAGAAPTSGGVSCGRTKMGSSCRRTKARSRFTLRNSTPPGRSNPTRA
jgi:hypothetical protein